VPASDISTDDLRYMRTALGLAAQGLGRVEPNPMVGAVLVRDRAVVGRGWHQAFGGPHAEVHALRQAGEAARGATLYVTLEPCCHHGKTPPCSDAVVAAGVSRVVAAMGDPFAAVSGRGFAQLRDAGIRVDVGLMEAEARQLNAPFLKRCLVARPYVLAKWAQTLDGRLTMAGRRWISSPPSLRLVHTLRSRMDGILVGIGTALADDPLLTVRPGPGQTDYGRRPTRIMLDAHLRLPLGSKLVQSARDVPLLVVCDEAADAAKAKALEEAGATVLRVPRDNDRSARRGEPAVAQTATTGRRQGLALAALLDELGRRGMTNLMVEGGAAVLDSFFREQLVDRVAVFVAPDVSGDASLPAAPGNITAASPHEAATALAQTLSVLHPAVNPSGADLVLEGAVRDW
jgi:diaminohydroxyphosphoribosylaminopyrimidine deaminase/5-amino-6-(5-phosphoribosylamino)uracil reductase